MAFCLQVGVEDIPSRPNRICMKKAAHIGGKERVHRRSEQTVL